MMKLPRSAWPVPYNQRLERVVTGRVTRFARPARGCGWSAATQARRRRLRNRSATSKHLSSVLRFSSLAGFVAASLLSVRALALMDASAKAALMDTLSSTRLLSLLVAGVFVVLILWRPLLGWAFLGFAYLGLGLRSVVRLRRLNLPPRS